MTDAAAVRALAEKRVTAHEQFQAADNALREGIREALAAGVGIRELIEATGLSKQRIYQIRDNRR